MVQHRTNKPYATHAVRKGYKVPVDVAKVHEKEVLEWIEKPEIDILAGIGVLVKEPKPLDILRDMFDNITSMDIMGGLIPELLKNNHRIMIYETDKCWYDVGSTEKYEKLDNELIDKLYQ